LLITDANDSFLPSLLEQRAELAVANGEGFHPHARYAGMPRRFPGEAMSFVFRKELHVSEVTSSNGTFPRALAHSASSDG
jgi:hypothetical protein